MANHYCCVRIDQQQREWHTDDGAPPDDHDAGPTQRDLIVVQQFEPTPRGCWCERRASLGETSEVHGVLPVYILGGLDCERRGFRAYAVRKRRKQQDAVNVWVGVEPAQVREKVRTFDRRTGSGQTVSGELALDLATVGRGG